MCGADHLAFFEAKTLLVLWENGSFLDETVGCKGLEGRERKREHIVKCLVSYALKLQERGERRVGGGDVDTFEQDGNR